MQPNGAETLGPETLSSKNSIVRKRRGNVAKPDLWTDERKDGRSDRRREIDGHRQSETDKRRHPGGDSQTDGDGHWEGQHMTLNN